MAEPLVRSVSTAVPDCYNRHIKTGYAHLIKPVQFGQTIGNKLMTKYHTTQKAAKNNSPFVLAIGYCDLQHALAYESATAYNAGRDGWNFDLYDINDKFSVVTGYRSMSRASTHEVNDYPELRAELKAYDKECRAARREHTAEGRDSRKLKVIEILEKHLGA